MRRVFCSGWVVPVLLLFLFAMGDAVAGTINYSYDAAGRLRRVDYGNDRHIEYSYDENGNLLGKGVNQASSEPDGDQGYSGQEAPPSSVGVSSAGCAAGCVASVTLKWSAVRGATGYLIYNADTNQLWKWVKGGTTTSYTFHNLPCGRTYHFYVKTHSDYGNSQPSKTTTVQIPPCSSGGGTENPTVTIVWPEKNAAVNYNDFDAADYLVVFAWEQADNAKAYLLWLKLDDGESAVEGQVVLFVGNGLVEAGDLAGIYFVLDKAGWNSLVPYTVTWQVSALSDPEDLSSIIGSSEKYSFTFEEASGE